MEVTAAVCQQAHRLFTSANAEEIITAFSTTELPLMANNGERVCLAILQISEGDMDRFHRELQEGRIDRQDTLLAAGRLLNRF